MHGSTLAALSIALLVSPAAVRAANMIELGGGVFTPFESDHRDVYGAAPVFAAGFSSRLGDRDTWFFVDVGYTRSSGQELTSDPTFELGDAEYQVVPVNLGVRTDVVKTPGHPVKLYLGAAWQTVFTRWEDPLLGSDRTPTFGVMFEVRPEFVVSDRWDVWVRQRISFQAGADYPSNLELNYSGSLLEAGFGWRLN